MENKKGKLGSRLAGSEAFLSVAASLICIVIGLLLGLVVLAIINAEHAFGDGLLVILKSGFKSPRNMGTVLANAAPLIMTGLSVGFAFKTGLFNIGAAGQYTLGAFGALYCAIVLQWPWYLCLLAAMLFGAIWGALPGIFKAYLNINEVIACIMTNWIAANIVTWLFDISNLKNMVENTKSGYIYKTTFNNVATSKFGLDKLFPGSQVSGGILIAIALAIVIYIVLTKTTFGYELRACGANRHAARYAGIHDKRNIVLSMAIAGALAGAAGSLYYLAGNTEFYWNTYQTLPAAGFNGIAVALLAVNNPIAVIFTGCFMSILDIAGMQITNLTAYNEYITDVIIAVIVYMAAFSLVIKMWISGRKKKKPAHTETAESTAEPAVPQDETGAGVLPAAEGKEAQE